MKLLQTGLALLIAGACAAQRNDNPEFFLSTQRKRLAVISEAAGFQPGDTIVDIGSGNGWFDAAFGVYHDSLTFYLEDLDSTNITNGKLKQALASYAKVRGMPITSRYTQIAGGEKSTGLPHAFCHKVLLIDTYHHLAYRDEMIQEMRRILKNKGKLIVYEPLARKPNDVLKACNSTLYTQDEIVSSFEKNGFHLDKIYKSVKNNRKRVRVFTFYKEGRSLVIGH
jgi:SAM-dependent methyltransferase